MGSEDRKPLMVKIISPEGIFYSFMQKQNVYIKSIVAKGVIPSKGGFSNIKDEAAYDFEILPDHSPFVAKVSKNSEIRIKINMNNNDMDSKYSTKNGGIVTVDYTNDNHTLAVFTLQDVKDPIEKNK
jgi:F0F1-type ATP synthase epsilon subunit